MATEEKKEKPAIVPGSTAANKARQQEPISEDDRSFEMAERSEDTSNESDTQQEGLRFGGIEIFFLIVLNLVGDLLDWLEFVRIIIAGVTLLWFWFKGVHSVIGRNAIAQAIEFIPVINWLPIGTAFVIITVISVNNPELFDKMGFIGSVAKKIMKASKVV